MTIRGLLDEWRASETFGRAFEQFVPSRTPHGNGAVVALTRTQAHDSRVYRAAKERAEESGVPLVIVEDEE